MNQKELNEIRRRFNPEKTNIGKVYGCYVNTAGNVVARTEVPLSLEADSEKEKYLAILKGALGGSLGKNLVSIPFSTADAADNEKHKLLCELRRTSLADPELREKLFSAIIAGFSIEDANLLILLCDEVYDVPRRSKNDDDDGSDSVYHYLLCAVCPVKDGRADLGYDHRDSAFHITVPSQLVGAPAVGFLFPAFDGRTANIYSALYFTRNAGEIHEDFVDAVFGTPAPMSSAEQKDTFCEVLAETLEEDCSFEVVQAVQGELRNRIAAHKESRDPEILEITPEEVGDILATSGVEEEKVAAFRTKCGEKFGGDTLLPANLVPQNRVTLETPDAKITVAPDAAVQVETRVIDGRKYILIPADEDVEINGMNVHVK